MLGRLNIQNNAPHLCGFVKHEIGVYETILLGKSAAKSTDTKDEERILHFLRERLENLK